ncbi:VRR-NUC domain-containing protein [Alcaligenaceae bacterium]|nr:VRR-NUC domain-containing protein [Alcaligenaceae bacterium]
MRESEIEDYLVQRVRGMGGEVRKVKWIGRRGAPDRLVMLPAARPPAPPLSEELTEYLDRLLKQPQEPCEKSTKVAAELDGILSRAGMSLPSRTIWVELKAPGEKAKPHQAREHERMRRMGQLVVVIDSIEGVEELLA